MDKIQENLFDRYSAEYASTHHLKLSDGDRQKAAHLFEECGRQWASNPSASIAEIAKSLGISETEDHIIDTVLFAWTKIYTE